MNRFGHHLGARKSRQQAKQKISKFGVYFGDLCYDLMRSSDLWNDNSDEWGGPAAAVLIRERSIARKPDGKDSHRIMGTLYVHVWTGTFGDRFWTTFWIHCPKRDPNTPQKFRSTCGHTMCRYMYMYEILIILITGTILRRRVFQGSNSATQPRNTHWLCTCLDHPRKTKPPTQSVLAGKQDTDTSPNRHGLRSYSSQDLVFWKH